MSAQALIRGQVLSGLSVAAMGIGSVFLAFFIGTEWLKIPSFFLLSSSMYFCARSLEVAGIRRNGIAVESKSLSSLRQATPVGWRLDCNVRLTKGGDADAVLRIGRQHSILIEVKSYPCVRPIMDPHAHDLIGLRYCSGRPTHKNAITQAVGARCQLGLGRTTAIVWLPKARGPALYSRHYDVAVVRGDADALVTFVHKKFKTAA